MAEAPKQQSFRERTRESMGYVARTASLVWRASRRLSIAYVALTLVASALPLGIAWVGKHLVGVDNIAGVVLDLPEKIGQFFQIEGARIAVVPGYYLPKVIAGLFNLV